MGGTTFPGLEGIGMTTGGTDPRTFYPVASGPKGRVKINNRNGAGIVSVTGDDASGPPAPPGRSEYGGAFSKDDHELAVERIRAWNRSSEQIARTMILEYIDKHGEAYSRELRDGISLDLSTAKIGKLLRAIENDGVLVSEIRFPPFKDCIGRMQRRYYWRAR